MKPIRIFDADVNFQAEISNYESLMFTRSFHGIGDLELRINRYKNYTDTLQKGNVIVVDKDLHKAYKIMHREIELDQSGKATENWLINALELKSVVGQRITLPPVHTSHDNRSASAETVMKHYISNNVITPVDGKRKIPQLILATDLIRGPQVNWQSRFKNVAEEMAEMSLMSGIGWGARIDYALRKWVFDVYEGRDLSVNQSINSPVIFSPLFDNIKNMHYVDSDLNYRNTAYIAGQGEGVERRVVELGQAVGLSRHELFVDARDVSEETEDEEPVPRPPQDIINDLINRGEQKLAELIQETFLEAQVMTNSTFKYEADWDLGDIVTTQYTDWGITLDARITEVKEIYEPETGFTLEATFGNNRPTLISKIKQELTGMKAEITR
ncbi:siphovirus ReqiPepy6 Gp37-like family protein [Sporosarcina sp. E16_3]|uniref:siphovirus ReqiPepy6 Gp37-like family protein n=1 Tax=Sporosarcina sp. E16_3 TaxID=2789293 RepID=UPI001A917914|nr:siphovirus ReqiPepy6 Gp37-like family protein [Sporosarcina sp. E16_3]MBO0602773.1 siphovirus ReqiPepy6 Gp37-like family protein [Sporosarcina sp. E16_3]